MNKPGLGAFAGFSCFFLGAALLFAGFFATFFVGEADRFRLFSFVLALLADETAFFFSPDADFFSEAAVFDRLRGLVDVVFFAVFFFCPAGLAAFFAGLAPSLKLPLAPTPLVCLSV